MRLGQIKQPRGAHRDRKRLGQGTGSGTGKTAGRGHKGQRARSGGARGRRTGFEGGQMPLHRRLPKRGFNNIFRTEYAILNVSTLEALEGNSFDPQTLLDLGVIHKLKDGLKVLGSGDLKRKITVKANVFSKSAEEKIKAAGGAVEVIPPKVRASKEG